MGLDANTEGEGADRLFALPGGQDDLIRQILSVNKNVIVVLTAGGNVDMTHWVDDVPALIHTWYPGQEGGTALAQVLFGEFSPSGKLPVTFERLQDRQAVRDRLDGARRDRDGQKSPLDDHYHRAFDLLTSKKVAQAFDVSAEPDRVRDARFQQQSAAVGMAGVLKDGDPVAVPGEDVEDLVERGVGK